MNTVNLIYIGEEFYAESGTAMSSIYTEDGDRFDWGFVNIELIRGNEVHIRPATDAELEKYYRILEKYRERKLRRAKK